MNLTYNDISPKLSGTFIREILCTFINKEPSIHDVQYMRNEVAEVESVIYGDYKLMLKVPVYNSKPYTNKFINNFFILDNKTIYLKEQNMPRMSIEEFEEDKFSLSTILSNDSMYDLKCSTYFSDIDFGTDICAIFIGNIISSYLDMHTHSL